MSSSSVFAFSCDGQFLAHSSPSGVIKVWETSTGRLKQEYIPSSHLSASCCCLSWCPWTNKSCPSSKSKRKKPPESSSTHRPDLIALGTASGSILLYSFVKGDLHSQLTDGHTDRITCVSWSSDDRTLFTSSVDHHVVEWDVPSASIRHKWKADNGAVYSVHHCQPHHVVTAARTIKLWDLDTRKVLRRYTGHSTEVCSLHHVTLQPASVDNTYVISAALDDRLINIWHVDLSKKDKSSTVSFSLPDDPVMLNVSVPKTESQYVMLAIVTKSGQVLVYDVRLNGQLKNSLTPSWSIYCVRASQQEIPVPVPICAATPKEDKVCVAYGDLLQPSFELVTRKADGTDVCLVRDCPSVLPTQTHHHKASISKVKTPSRSENMTALAPGHMAPSQPITGHVPAKTKRKTGLTELTIGERLNAISIDEKSESVTEAPRADTMAVLLMQGLQSNDKTIINNVLQNCTETVMRNTVSRLSVSAVVPLVRELARRMHGHAQSGIVLSRWIKTVLSVHTSYLMSLPEIVDVCSSMYQMMDCRVNLYTRLSKLQGRLDLLLSQISEHSVVSDELSDQQPLLIYHEESSDDDDMLEDIINPHSESEDNWCDTSDDGGDEMDEN